RRAGDRTRPRPDRHRLARRDAEGRGRLRRRRPGARPGQDRGDRAPPRHGPDGPRLRAGLRPAARRVRRHALARRAQRRPRRRRPRRARPARRMPTYANARILTMDAEGTEHARGWIHVEDGLIAEVGDGDAEGEDLGGAIVTPGLVNTHHHLYQTLTRARATEGTLFEWLVECYPIWAGLDAEAEYAAARTGLAELGLSGCSTVFDHHYVFPRGADGL